MGFSSVFQSVSLEFGEYFKKKKAKQKPLVTWLCFSGQI